jgi:hypothetical protein
LLTVAKPFAFVPVMRTDTRSKRQVPKILHRVLDVWLLVCHVSAFGARWTFRKEQRVKTKTAANGESTYDIKKSLAVLRAPFDKFTDQCREMQYAGVDLAERLKDVDPTAIPHRVQLMIAEQKSDKATVRLEMDIPAWIYGKMCEAAVVHELGDWREALRLYLECTVCEWSSDQGFYLDL